MTANMLKLRQFLVEKKHEVISLCFCKKCNCEFAYGVNLKGVVVAFYCRSLPRGVWLEHPNVTCDELCIKEIIE